MKKQFDRYKNLIKLIIAFLLFFTASLIEIPIAMIFNINIFTASDTILYALSICSKIFLAGCLFLMYRKELIKNFKDFVKNFWDIADTSIKYWLVGLVVMAGSNLLIQTFSPVKVANNEAVVQSMITEAPLVAFILTTIFAPFIEEIVFRKAFKNVFKEKNLYILISGLVFGSLHVISIIKTPYDYLYLIPYCALGISFAALCYKTDNIFSSIFVHTLHNGIITIMSIIGMGMILL